MTPADIASLTGKAPVYLSPVTIAELTFGAEIASDPGVRQKRLAALRRLQSKPLLTIDAGTATTFGGLAATIKLQGKKPRSRIQDLWLASQAIQHGHTLLTRNKRDFEDIPGLDLASI